MIPGKRVERHVNRCLKRPPCGIPDLGISLVNMMKACDQPYA